MLNPLLKINKAIPGIAKKIINPLAKVERKLSSLVPWNVVSAVTSATVLGKGLFDAYAPKSLKKQKFYIEYKEGTAIDSAATKKQMYFDGVFRTEHLNSRQITSHPVHTSANISDHSYKIPSSLSIDVGVSDVMGSFNPVGVIMGDANSRSINAFKKLLDLEDSGEPVTVYTRLMKYENMVIESVRAREDAKSINEMRATINFQQVIIASGVGKTKVSREAFTSNKNDLGVKSTENVKPNQSEGRLLTGMGQ